MSETATWANPLIRWAGSKRKLLHHLVSAAPPSFRRYYEPFVGSGCLFFALRPGRATLGDINTVLIETYRTIKSHPRLLQRRAVRFPLDSRSYYALRELREPMVVIDKAARFLVLNRLCFNGLYRTNRNGYFNVPFGSRGGSLPSEAAFYRASIALRTARLVSGDFERTVEGAARGDFVYFDPPYVYNSRRNRGEYGADTFCTSDIERLIARMRILDARGVHILLSYIDCEEIREVTRAWKTRVVPVQRQISGFSRHRRIVNELLISNYDF
jgi:DNA adenine methylase